MFSLVKFTSLFVNAQLVLVLAEEVNSWCAIENFIFSVASC